MGGRQSWPVAQHILVENKVYTVDTLHERMIGWSVPE
jgi:hypothetical protein